MAAPLALLAMLVELAIGYPDALVKRIGHPVTWIGALITALDARLNKPDARPRERRNTGLIALAILLSVVGIAAFLLESVLIALPFGLLFVSLAASTLIAQRSLYVHVKDVATALESNLDDARVAVGKIVGRDTAELDEAGIARAAIESLAENFSDGVVSPVFWLGLTGLTGGAIYKAVNTADSMIGHKSERYADFGCAAAKLDDLVNLPGARLSALLIVAAANTMPNASAARAWQAMRRDARKHASPNAGYPEAAMAGALGLALGGPRRYGSTDTPGPWLGDGRCAATADDIRAALQLYAHADALLIAILAALAGLSAIM